jgi:nitrogen fixation-related uncharacterized protein
MEILMVFLLVAAGFLVLGLAALAWGVDSRETEIDSRRR